MEKKILVVDDDESVKTLLVTAFESKGYSVISAESGEEALALLADEPCLVMFLDIVLPGMDGLELCQKIKTDYPMAVCYAITGHTSMLEVANYREFGFDDLLIKPISLQLLHKAAADAFEKLDRWMGK